jgi:hypothetical protein
MAAYRRKTTWHFTADGVDFAITYYTDDMVHVEESRKNGQEDTHFYGELTVEEGRWALDDEGRDHLDMYEKETTADALEEYLNQNGLPHEAEEREARGGQ